MSLATLKKLSAAAAILLLAWVVYVYRLVPHEKAPFAKASDKTEEIVFSQGSRELILRRESGQWKVGLASAPLYAADAQLVKPLISSLKDLQVEEEITDRADRAADYDVTAETGIRVRLLDARKANLAEGIFGKQAPDMAHLYFRYADKPNVYLARGLIRGDLGRIEVNYWRSRQLIDIPETKIQHIVVEGKGFRTELVRVSTDAWTLNGKPVDPAPVNTLVGTLSHLRADDFVDPAADPKLSYDGLTYARLNVKGADASAELRIGAQDAKTKRYPVSIGQDAGLAWLSESSAKAILKKPLSR
jgi:hypothetical protein